MRFLFVLIMRDLVSLLVPCPARNALWEIVGGRMMLVPGRPILEFYTVNNAIIIVIRYLLI